MLPVAYVLFFYKNFLAQDQSMYLYAGKLILEGKVPFKDFFDINPPLIMYFNAGIVYLSNLFQADAIVFFKTFVLFDYFFLISVSWLFIKRLFRPQKNDFIVFSLAMSIMLMTMVFYYFWGQRDEMFTMALIPYLLLKCYRMFSDEESERFPIHPLLLVPAIFLLGITICFKPHFFLHFIAAEAIFFFFRKKSSSFFTVELISVIFIAFSYFGFLLIMPKPAFDYFWYKHIFEVSKYYHSFNLQPEDNFLDHSLLVVVFLSIGLLSFKQIKFRLNTTSFFLLQGLISFLVVAFQGRFFTYHFSTAFIISVFLFIILFIQVRNQSRARFDKGALIGISLLFLSIMTYKGYRYLIHIRSTEIRFSAILNNTLGQFVQPGDCVLSFSSVPRVTYPAVNNLQLENCSRYLFQYKLSFFGSHRNQDLTLKNLGKDKEAFLQQEQAYFEEIKEDILKHRPKIIYYYMFPGSRQNMPYDFPLDQYIASYGLKKLIEQTYEKRTDGIFTVYLRKTEDL